MKKNILLLMSLFLSEINVFANDNPVAESVVNSELVKYAVQITPENQEKQELELTWQEKSVINRLSSLYNNKQLTQNNLKLFIESSHNFLNNNAQRMQEVDFCAILEKKKIIITKEIDAKNIRRLCCGKFAYMRWAKLLYGIGCTRFFVHGANELDQANLKNTIANMSRRLEGSYPELVQDRKLMETLVSDAHVISLVVPVLLAGTAYCGYRVYRLYDYYTYISSRENKVKTIDAMINTIKAI